MNKPGTGVEGYDNDNSLIKCLKVNIIIVDTDAQMVFPDGHKKDHLRFCIATVTHPSTSF